MTDVWRSSDPLCDASASTRRIHQFFVHLYVFARKNYREIARCKHDDLGFNLESLVQAFGAKTIPGGVFSKHDKKQPNGTAAARVAERMGKDCNAFFNQHMLRDNATMKVVLHGDRPAQKGGNVPAQARAGTDNFIFAFPSRVLVTDCDEWSPAATKKALISPAVF
ncbi:MAG: hypothetical protein MHM6MM_001354 [Cercozoa sp. M6MM]